VKPRFRFQLRTMLVAVVVLAAMSAYVSSYHRLSRRGMREAADHGLPGFLYTPAADAVATGRLGRHHLLVIVYAPANWTDRLLFEGQAALGPFQCHMSLSG